MENLFDISQQVVVITGGTGVLGRTISKYLALQGAKVAILGRKAEVGHTLVEDIRQEGGVASFHVCDVLDKERLQTTCDEILQLYGHIDTLLNGAGGNMPGAIGIPEEQLRLAAQKAVCKINIDSDLRLAMTASIRKYFNEHPDHFDPRQYLSPARDAIKAMVKHKIVDVLGCDGKA